MFQENHTSRVNRSERSDGNFCIGFPRNETTPTAGTP